MTLHEFAIWSPRPNALPFERISESIVIFGKPVLKITPLKISCHDINYVAKANVIIFTSQHSVASALKQIPHDKLNNKTIVSIGKKTASALRSQGFKSIIALPPYSSESLLNNTELQQEDCNLVAIIGGVGGRGLLEASLSAQNKNVYKLNCYQRDKINLSAKDMVKFINENKIAGIIISSTEIADQVSALLNKTDLSFCFDMPIFVLSERIATYASRIGFSRVFVAERAGQDFLYTCIKNWWNGELDEQE